MRYDKKNLRLIALLFLVPFYQSACRPQSHKPVKSKPPVEKVTLEANDRLAQLALRLKGRPQGEQLPVEETKRVDLSNGNCPSGAQLFGAAPPKGNLLFCAKPGSFGKVKMGSYTKWDEKGVKRYEAYFVEDALEGGVTNYYPNGDKSDYVEYQKGIPNGLLQKWNRRGVKVLEGRVSNGKKSGYFHYWTPEGVPSSEGVLRDELRNGLWTFFDRIGNAKTKIHFKDGEKEGKAEGFYANGSLAYSGAYLGNKPDGLWTYFSKSGRVEKRGHFAAGRKVGEWQVFNEKGKLVSTKQLQQPAPKNGSGSANVIDSESGFVQM